MSSAVATLCVVSAVVVLLYLVQKQKWNCLMAVTQLWERGSPVHDETPLRKSVQ